MIASTDLLWSSDRVVLELLSSSNFRQNPVLNAVGDWGNAAENKIEVGSFL